MALPARQAIDYENIYEAEFGNGWADSHCQDAPGRRCVNHVHLRKPLACTAGLFGIVPGCGCVVECRDGGIERSDVTAEGYVAGTPRQSRGADKKRPGRKGKVGNRVSE